MGTGSEAVMGGRLERYLSAERALRGANSQAAAAVSMFLSGKMEREELAVWSAKAMAAEKKLNEAERMYRHEGE